jgi:arsenate reductase
MSQTLSNSDFPVTIYHNSRCSNSRCALALIRERGIEPRIVDYLAEPLNAAALTALLGQIGRPVRELLRNKEAVYAELQLDRPELGDAELIAAVAAHPQLLNRPIVVTSRGAALCRPPEMVLALLPT